MQMRRVVLTGLGALTPIGEGIPAYWEGLVNGVSGAAPITNFDASKAKTQFACELKQFDGSKFFDRKELRKYDKFSQYGLVAADEALTGQLRPARANPAATYLIFSSIHSISPRAGT